MKARVDRACENYLALVGFKRTTENDVQAAKDGIVRLCEKFGSIPQGAKKSFRIEGTKFQATASYGVSTVIDLKRVEQLRAWLKGAKKSALMKKLFLIEPRFVLAPTAAETLEKLPPAIRELAERCIITQAHSGPSLKVEEKKKSTGKKGK